MWAGVAAVLLGVAVWMIMAGLDGLAYMRQWPTMSDGSIATGQLVVGGLAALAAAYASWCAVTAVSRAGRAGAG